MPLNAKLALVHRFGKLTSTIEGQFVDAKTQVSQVRNEVRTAGYGLLNLRSSYEWKNIRLDVGIENVLDKFYSPAVGRGICRSGSDHVGKCDSLGYSRSRPGPLVLRGRDSKVLRLTRRHDRAGPEIAGRRHAGLTSANWRRCNSLAKAPHRNKAGG